MVERANWRPAASQSRDRIQYAGMKYVSIDLARNIELIHVVKRIEVVAIAASKAKKAVLP